MMIENWETKDDQEKPLMFYLDSEMQNDFKNQVLNIFKKEKSDKGLILLTSMFNVDNDEAMMNEYF